LRQPKKSNLDKLLRAGKDIYIEDRIFETTASGQVNFSDRFSCLENPVFLLLKLINSC
jgi:hypothetical protein